MALPLPPRRQRGSNFTNPEIITLLEEVLKYRDVILSPQKSLEKNDKKKIVWQRIASLLTMKYGKERTEHQCRTRFKDMGKDVRKQQREEKEGKDKKGPFWYTDKYLEIYDYDAHRDEHKYAADSLTSSLTADTPQDLLDELTDRQYSVEVAQDAREEAPPYVKVEDPKQMVLKVEDQVSLEGLSFLLSLGGNTHEEQPQADNTSGPSHKRKHVTEDQESSIITTDHPVNLDKFAPGAKANLRIAKKVKKQNTAFTSGDDKLVDRWLRSEIRRNESEIALNHARLELIQRKLQSYPQNQTYPSNPSSPPKSPSSSDIG